MVVQQHDYGRNVCLPAKIKKVGHAKRGTTDKILYEHKIGKITILCGCQINSRTEMADNLPHLVGDPAKRVQ